MPIVIPPVDDDIDCDYCSTNTGTLTLNGRWYRHPSESTSTSIVPARASNKTLTVIYKTCTAPTMATVGERGRNNTIPYRYCKSGTLHVEYVTTNCDGDYTVSVTNCTALAVLPGRWELNPNFNCNLPFSDPNGRAYRPDPLFYYEYTTFCSPAPRVRPGTGHLFETLIGGGQVRYVDIDFGTGSISYLQAQTGGWLTDMSPSATVFGQRFSVCTRQFIGRDMPCVNFGLSLIDPVSGWGTSLVTPLYSFNEILLRNVNCYLTYRHTGTFTCDLYSGLNPSIIPYVTLDGRHYQVGGMTLTVGDSCGRSENLPTAYSPYTLRPNVIDWKKINSVVATLALPAPNCSLLRTTGTDGVYFRLYVSSYALDVARVVNGSNAHLANYCETNTFGAQLYFNMNPISCPEGSVALKLSADTYQDGVTIAWIDPDGKLKSVCHPNLAGFLGQGTESWRPVQTLEAANADDVGLSYLASGLLYVTYSLSGTPKYRTSESILPETAAEWSAAGTPSPNVARHSDQSRLDRIAYRWRAMGGAASGGNIEVSRAIKNFGELWTDMVVAVTDARTVYCGGVLTGDGAQLLYLKHSDSTVYSKFTVDPDNWGGGTGVAHSNLAGTPVGLTYTPSGVLVGLLYQADKKVRVCRSANGGLKWEIFPAVALVPAMDTPPALVLIGAYPAIVWVQGDVPNAVLSTDGGETWQ